MHSGQDRKWDENSPACCRTRRRCTTPTGRQRKLIIFTEHRDTLNYLAVKIRGLIGSEEAVVMIHGGVKREERARCRSCSATTRPRACCSPPTRRAKA